MPPTLQVDGQQKVVMQKTHGSSRGLQDPLTLVLVDQAIAGPSANQQVPWTSKFASTPSGVVQGYGAQEEGEGLILEGEENTPKQGSLY